MLVIISSFKSYNKHTPHKYAYWILRFMQYASKHMNMHISNAINQIHELAPLLVCFSLPKNFTLFMHFCSLLIMSILSHPLCHHISKDNFISLSNLSPFVINNHKGTPLLIQKVVLGVDDWFLNLHFWWTPPYVGITSLVTITCGNMKTILKCHM
jgi:hypothetical protein